MLKSNIDVFFVTSFLCSLKFLFFHRIEYPKRCLDLLTTANKTTTCTTGARHTGVEIYMVWFKGNCSTVE